MTELWVGDIIIIYQHYDPMVNIYDCCFYTHCQYCDIHLLHTYIYVFPVAAAKVWNALPPAITSLPLLQAFKRALKTELPQFIRQCKLSATAALTLQLWCNTWHIVALKFCIKTCVAMKFVDDDDDLLIIWLWISASCLALSVFSTCKVQLCILCCYVAVLNDHVKEWCRCSEFRQATGTQTRYSIILSAVYIRRSVSSGATKNRVELCQLPGECKE